MRIKLSKRKKANPVSGEELVYCRVLANLSAAEVARRSGLTQKHAYAMERQRSVGSELVVRYLVAIVKELRAQIRCAHSSHGVPPVDLDQLLNQERDFGVPLTGSELAKAVRLRTHHELEAFAKRHGLKYLHGPEVRNKRRKGGEVGRLQSTPHTSGVKQIIFGTDLKPQPMVR